jgi:hypothetical protein
MNMRFLTTLFLLCSLFSCTTTKKEEKPEAPTNTVDKVIGDYLTLKNAFFSNDSTTIAKATTVLLQSLKIDTSNLGTPPVTNKTALLQSTTKLLATLDSLSKGTTIKEKLMVFKNMTNTVKEIGTLSSTQNLYVQHCPMAEDYSADAKVYWISNTEKIQNPFYPRKMPTCGVVVDTIAQTKK